MSFFIEISLIFAIGCSFGWALEVIFRRFWSGNNRSRKWINPGYLNGPWLPVYGFGLCILYVLSGLESLLPMSGVPGKLMLIVIMTLSVTLVELIAGLISVHLLKAELWDYSGEWGNYKGLICPRFALFWGIICAMYLLFVHSTLLLLAKWLSQHAEFSVFVGIYLGFVLVDTLGLNLSRGKSFLSEFNKFRLKMLKNT